MTTVCLTYETIMLNSLEPLLFIVSHMIWHKPAISACPPYDSSTKDKEKSLSLS